MEIEVRKDYYRDSGELMTEKVFFNGMQHGIQVWFYKNGNILSKHHCKNDFMHGIDQEWHFDQTRFFISQWKKDISNGIYLEFMYEN
jgi:antitoxin component YwqK of YwqJK toxin-antitoxin module